MKTEKQPQKQETKEDKKDLEIKELTESLQRLQADFENYRKQVEKQCLSVKKYAKADIISKLLPVLDSFELALKNTKNNEELKKGVELIFSQLFQSLEDFGLRPIIAKGKLDPYKHEVLLTQESDKDENTILEELQKGYMLDDIVVRHTKVKVSKKKSGDTNGKGASDNEHKC